MLKKDAKREGLLARLEQEGGVTPGVSERLAADTGVPAAEIYGAGRFYSLLTTPAETLRVCQGLSCRLAGSAAHQQALAAEGHAVREAACLARCDAAPAVWRPDRAGVPEQTGLVPSRDDQAIDLSGSEQASYASLALARERGPEAVFDALEAAGLQGRGGAGFPAHIKWRAVARQPGMRRYVVLNADEGEPGTFKDREVMQRRPGLVIEGLAIAATSIGASAVYCFVRRELSGARDALRAEVERARSAGWIDDTLEWHFVDGQGAYVCGEETALLEAVEGRRGMPRLKPPLPVERGLFGQPTLIQNVETIACVPRILERGGAWFRACGREEAGSKLYCVSGHVGRPGVYELPLGATLDELLEHAQGSVGELKAFSPGGASSGFLPAAARTLPLDFGSLSRVGSMLGSAGVVVLGPDVDMREAALAQAEFFEDESCGQCTPCRIGTRVLREAIERSRGGERGAFAELEDVHWVMEQSSICGLGQAAPLPLRSALAYFPEDFGLDTTAKGWEAPGE
jgi:NADH:ubiquinone oxidoreductase subunit F (NADH-binding)